MKRAIKRYENQVKDDQEIDLSLNKPTMIAFDGKKDNTLVSTVDEMDKSKVTVQQEEHVTVISEPHSKYLTHLSPGSKGVEIAQAIHEYLKNNNILESVKIVGADSTAVNTGWQNGVIALLEQLKGERLLRSICSLHLNELPLRHGFQDIDGKTDSRNTFKGPIGKLLPNIENFNLRISFPSVGSNISNETVSLSEAIVSDLSSDQKFLYLAWKSVIDGKLNPDLLSLSPGPISHARWLTLAVRILLLWMSDCELSREEAKSLRVIVNFVVTNYCPQWFAIKQQGALESGPK